LAQLLFEKIPVIEYRFTYNSKYMKKYGYVSTENYDPGASRSGTVFLGQALGEKEFSGQMSALGKFRYREETHVKAFWGC
jgi:hypothetical protein